MHQAIQNKGRVSTRPDPSSPTQRLGAPFSRTGEDKTPAIQSLLDALRQVIGHFPFEDGLADLSLHRAIRAKEVMQMTGDKRSHFYDRLNTKSSSHDPTFPRPFRLGCSTRSPTVFWAHEIVAWLKTRALTSRKN